MNYQEAYHHAQNLVKKAGFTLSQVSKLSEACYYSHPARKPLLLRLATHSSKRAPIGLRSTTVAKATFSSKERHAFSELHIQNLVAIAIGRYFLSDPKPSGYFGKKGTWDEQSGNSGDGEKR